MKSLTLKWQPIFNLLAGTALGLSLGTSWLSAILLGFLAAGLAPKEE